MTTVTFKCGSESREFGIEQAQALLDYEKQIKITNWSLDDNNFEIKDGLIKRKNSKPDKESKEQKVDSEGDRPSE